MKRNVTINKKAYGVKKIDFNAICELEDYGVSLADLATFKKKPFSLFRGCFAFHSGLTLEQASNEMEQHLVDGGTFDDFQPFVDALVESDFFDKLAKSQAKK